MIDIKGRYFIDMDNYNYILRERRIIQTGKKKGEIKEATVGYYCRLEQLLMRVRELMINERVAGKKEISGIIEAIGEGNKEAMAEIEKILKEFRESKKEGTRYDKNKV